jgi:hypothetical protein
MAGTAFGYVSAKVLYGSLSVWDIITKPRRMKIKSWLRHKTEVHADKWVFVAAIGIILWGIFLMIMMAIREFFLRFLPSLLKRAVRMARYYVLQYPAD